MGIHGFRKSSGNWFAQTGEVGFKGKKKDTLPGKALFMVQGGQVLGK